MTTRGEFAMLVAAVCVLAYGAIAAHAQVLNTTASTATTNTDSTTTDSTISGTSIRDTTTNRRDEATTTATQQTATNTASTTDATRTPAPPLTPPPPATTTPSTAGSTLPPAATTTTAKNPTATSPTEQPVQRVLQVAPPPQSTSTSATRPTAATPPPPPPTQQRTQTTATKTTAEETRPEVRPTPPPARATVTTKETAPVEEDTPATHQFDPREREQVLSEIKSHTPEQRKETSAHTREASTTNATLSVVVSPVTPVLKSSLEDIALLIKKETGIDVDLSPRAREIIPTIQEATSTRGKVRTELLQRDGLELYNDTDADGISDYDEKHLYSTDPRNAHTSGSALTDGERVLLGFDPLSTSAQRVPVESPQTSSDTTANIFEVATITHVDAVRPPTGTSTPPIKPLRFAGRGLPNSFVTLYIFSTPVVVTVKTDTEGRWNYTLDSELENGNHELYVATVDNAGKILAKSPAVPFVQTAEAVEFTPLLIVTASPDPDPVDILNNNFIAIAALIALAFTIGALAILGIMRRHNPETPTSLT